MDFFTNGCKQPNGRRRPNPSPTCSISFFGNCLIWRVIAVFRCRPTSETNVQPHGSLVEAFDPPFSGENGDEQVETLSTGTLPGRYPGPEDGFVAHRFRFNQPLNGNAGEFTNANCVPPPARQPRTLTVSRGFIRLLQLDVYQGVRVWDQETIHMSVFLNNLVEYNALFAIADYVDADDYPQLSHEDYVIAYSDLYAWVVQLEPDLYQDPFQVLFHHCVNPLALPQSMVLSSSLNGNNGEWTGSDDLASRALFKKDGTPLRWINSLEKFEKHIESQAKRRAIQDEINERTRAHGQMVNRKTDSGKTKVPHGPPLVDGKVPPIVNVMGDTSRKGDIPVVDADGATGRPPLVAPCSSSDPIPSNLPTPCSGAEPASGVNTVAPPVFEPQLKLVVHIVASYEHTCRAQDPQNGFVPDGFSFRCGWDGTHFYLSNVLNGPMSAPGVPDVQVENQIDEDETIENIGKSGPGWGITSEKGKSTTIGCAFFDIQEAGIQLPTGYSPELKGSVFWPLLNKLSIDIPRTGVTGSSRTHAAHGLASKYYNHVDEEIIKRTLRKWTRDEARHSGLEVLTQENRALGATNVVMDNFCAASIPQFASLGVNTQFESFVKIPGVECDLQDDYLVKNTYRVVMKGGVCDLSTVSVDDLHPKVYPRFNSTALPGSTARYARTNFFRLRGASHAQFVDYNVSGINAMKAAKRLLGARDCESLLYGNQINVLRRLTGLKTGREGRFSSRLQEPVINSRVLETLKVSFECDRLKTRLATRPPVLPVVSSTGVVLEPGVVFGPEEVTQPAKCCCIGKKQVNAAGFVVPGPHCHLVDNANLVDKPDEVVSLKAIEAIALRLVSRSSRTYIDKVLDFTYNKSRWLYLGGWLRMLEFVHTEESRMDSANIRHLKQKLRKQYVKSKILHEDSDTMILRLDATVKKEMGKWGKVPRLYVSYGAGCMAANELPEYIKMALANPIHFERGSLLGDGPDGVSITFYVMSKPRDTLLDEFFTALMRSVTTKDCIVGIIYSDDSCIAGNYKGVKFGFNMDIKSCDTSNNSLVFALVGSMLARLHEIRACSLLSQCMYPVTIRNPDNPAETLVVSFHSAFEGSGTVLTTILNHVATLLILAGFIDMLRHRVIETNDDIKAAIVSGAALVGHQVTLDSWVVDQVVVFEKIQFLKYSPIKTTTGKYIPVRNLGCLLRGFGTIENDMEAKHLGISDEVFKLTPWDLRMEQFCGSVVRSVKAEPQCAIMTAMRDRFLAGIHVAPLDGLVQEVGYVPDQLDVLSEEFVPLASRASYTLCESSLALRYGMADYEMDELCSSIRQLRLGTHSCTMGAAKIYCVDYDLPIQ